MDSNIDPEIDHVSLTTTGNGESTYATPRTGSHGPLDDDEAAAMFTASSALKLLEGMSSLDEGKENLVLLVLLVLVLQEKGKKDKGSKLVSTSSTGSGSSNINNKKTSRTKILSNSIDDEPELSFVMMDPSTKKGLSKRLGRPRHLLKSLNSPQHMSLSNSEELTISKFRFQNPGNNGGSSGFASSQQVMTARGELSSEMTYKQIMNSKSNRASANGTDEVSEVTMVDGNLRSKKRKIVYSSNGLKMVMEMPGHAHLLNTVNSKPESQQEEKDKENALDILKLKKGYKNFAALARSAQNSRLVTSKLDESRIMQDGLDRFRIVDPKKKLQLRVTSSKKKDQPLTKALPTKDQSGKKLPLQIKK